MLDVCRNDNVTLGIVSGSGERLRRGGSLVSVSALIGVLVLVMVFWFRLVYCTEAQCLVKTGSELSRPIPVQRGIRQGCL